MTRILGIDPGRTGALAIVDTSGEGGACRVTVQDMPDITSGLMDALIKLPPVAFATVEKPFYPPQIGTRAISVIAEQYGALKAALLFAGIPLREVRPADWKKALNLGPDKAASREKASAIFPDDDEQWRLAKHHGRAEAALIAWYGRKFA